nr:CIH_HP1_G0023730.mRNA.1.CDS.1 [Saccharomyces cerevisiae]
MALTSSASRHSCYNSGFGDEEGGKITIPLPLGKKRHRSQQHNDQQPPQPRTKRADHSVTY